MKKLILVIVACLVISVAQGRDEDGWSFWVGTSWNAMSVSNLPQYLRDVPPHEGDGGWSSGTIERANYSFSFCIPYDIRYTFPSRRDVKFGLSLAISLPLVDFAERNYTNHWGTDERGVGAALTFSGITILGPLSSLAGVRPLPAFNLTPRVFIEAPLGDATMHTSLGYQSLSAINGWDRFDDLECYQTEVLAHLISLNIGIGSTLWGVDYEIGPSILLPIKTEVGKNSGAKVSSGLYLMFRIPIEY